MTYVYTATGDETHAKLCEAFIRHHGFLLIDGALHEIIAVERLPEIAGQVWEARRVREPGTA